MRNYTIDVEAIDGYIRYLKDYRHTAESAQKSIQNKLTNVHDKWDDINYELTQKSMGEIKGQLDKLFASFQETIDSLNEMTKSYKDYLTRRRR